MAVKFTKKSWHSVVAKYDPDFRYEGDHHVCYSFGGGDRGSRFGRRTFRSPGPNGGAYIRAPKQIQFEGDQSGGIEFEGDQTGPILFEGDQE